MLPATDPTHPGTITGRHRRPEDSFPRWSHAANSSPSCGHGPEETSAQVAVMGSDGEKRGVTDSPLVSRASVESRRQTAMRDSQSYRTEMPALSDDDRGRARSGCARPYARWRGWLHDRLRKLWMIDRYEAETEALEDGRFDEWNRLGIQWGAIALSRSHPRQDSSRSRLDGRNLDAADSAHTGVGSRALPMTRRADFALGFPVLPIRLDISIGRRGSSRTCSRESIGQPR